MKTFTVEASHPAHRQIRIVTTSFSRNDTSFDIQIDGESILSARDRWDGRIRTYAAMGIDSATKWVVKKLNEVHDFTFPDAPTFNREMLKEYSINEYIPPYEVTTC